MSRSISKAATPASARTAAPALLAHPADPAIFAGCVLVAILAVGERLLGDPDSQWHIRVGADIWRAGALPVVDAYSHTFAGAAWIAKEWGAQLVFAGLHALGGWSGVVLGSGVILALLFGSMLAWVRVRVRSTLAIVFVLLAILLLAPHCLARPFLFGHLGLLAWTAALVGTVGTGRPPRWTWLLVLVAWANLHGSVAIAYPIAAAFGLEALLAAAPAERLRTALRWGLFGLAALVAGCVTPYGAESLGVTASLFGSGEPLPFLREWQPIDLDIPGLAGIASAVVLIGLLALEPRRNLVRMLLLAALAAMFVRHVRFLDVYAIVAPLIAAGPLARRFAFCRPELTDEPERPGRLRIGLAAALLAAAVALVVVRHPEPPENVAPRTALAAARAAGLSGPVYNYYDFGGFLILEGVPTFVDGRTDQLFLGGFLRGLLAAIDDAADAPFLDILARHGVTWALVKSDSKDARYLAAAPGWRQIHADAEAAVFARADGLRGTDGGGAASGAASP